jgi:hypothetical protein
MIHAHAGRHAGFKRCCMLTGRYDGAERDYFFSRVISGRKQGFAISRSLATLTPAPLPRARRPRSPRFSFSGFARIATARASQRGSLARSSLAVLA